MTGLIVTPMWAGVYGSHGLVRPPGDDYVDEEPLPQHRRRLSVLMEREAIARLLGALYVDTTMLPLPYGGCLGPALDRDGHVLRWSLWAPHSRALLDRFMTREPSLDEIEDRVAFVRTHELRYGQVKRGERLTVDAVKRWMSTWPVAV